MTAPSEATEVATEAAWDAAEVATEATAEVATVATVAAAEVISPPTEVTALPAEVIASPADFAVPSCSRHLLRRVKKGCLPPLATVLNAALTCYFQIRPGHNIYVVIDTPPAGLKPKRRSTGPARSRFTRCAMSRRVRGAVWLVEERIASEILPRLPQLSPVKGDRKYG